MTMAKKLTPRADRSVDRWLGGLILFLVVVSTVAILLSLVGLHWINQNETRDRDTARATAYRLCSRNAIDRAFAHKEVKRRAGVKVMLMLQDVKELAILNCRPNLYGFAAVPMKMPQYLNFMYRYEHHQLTSEELGICPKTPIGAKLVPGRC
jgi:hypothetical protein